MRTYRVFFYHLPFFFIREEKIIINNNIHLQVPHNLNSVPSTYKIKIDHAHIMD